MTEIVAILDAETLAPLFDGASPMRVTVRETSKIISWPTEDGTQRTEHRVLDPVEIDMPVMITDDNKGLFESLRQAFIEGRDLVIQTQMRSYEKMMIQDFPHDESPEQGDSVIAAIKFKEVIVIQPEFGTLPPSKVDNKAQSSTVKRGGQQTSEADAPTQRKASALYGFLN